jgi:hypothetical protein
MKPEHHLTGAGNMLDRSGHDFTRDEARDIAMAKISSDRICVEPLICIETRINLYIRIYIYTYSTDYRFTLYIFHLLIAPADFLPVFLWPKTLFSASLIHLEAFDVQESDGNVTQAEIAQVLYEAGAQKRGDVGVNLVGFIMSPMGKLGDRWGNW